MFPPRARRPRRPPGRRDVYELSSGRPRYHLRTREARLGGLAFSDDGRILAVGDTSGGLTLCDLPRGVCKLLGERFGAATVRIAPSPDGALGVAAYTTFFAAGCTQVLFFSREVISRSWI